MAGSPPDVTCEDIWDLFTEVDHPCTPVTATEVASKLDCPRHRARNTLTELTERGDLRSKQIDGATRVWWRSSGITAIDQQFDQEEFTAIVNAVEDYAIFMLDVDGTVVSWNNGAERIKGYEEAEIIGEHFSTFYTDEDINEGAPEQNLETAAREGKTEDEGWRVREDGSRFWANVTITAIRDEDDTLQGFTKVTRDMTERREYEQQLRQERNLTEQIFETVPVSLYTVNFDGNFIQANQRALERIDSDESELTEYAVDSWEIYDSEGEPIPLDEYPWARVVETGEPVYDYECQTDVPDGRRRWLSINAAPIRVDHHDTDRIVSAIDDITEQKEREQKLRREYKQTEKLLRTAPIAIAVQGTEGDTVMANERAQEALGLSEQEIIEEPSNADKWEIYDTNGELISPSETPSARALATGESVLHEEIIIDPPNGERMQFRLNATPLFGSDGTIERVITTGEDITELKKRERQLERQKTELETELSEVFDRVSDAFYALDNEWRFTHLNEQAAEILQRSRTELLDREIWEVLPEAPEVYREQFKKALETQETVTFERYIADIDSWLGFNVYPSETGLSIYFRDITERKEYQQKLEESNERLEQFAYAASHDLQEPLRMVSSYLKLLEQRYSDDLDEDAQEFIEFAVDGAERMSEMIEALLEYSRIETQGDPFHPIDLDAVLSDVRADLQLQITESNAEITAESLPRVEGDRSQLRQVFQNLLDNAIEYSGDEPPHVQITAERNGTMWEVSVHDNGIGIDSDDSDRVFEVFQRLHSHEEHSGTGIGLALCRRIVERHGGKIWVESSPNEGATFSFTVPATKAGRDNRVQ
ncbi:PAS domain S-box protein [Natrinema versiforme]|uniref:histidine kinase n=1 Tax=Natrinema versiforme TaxID=88724 RepID=A0A4P8WIQ6_9EURY|nr:PAS domain S-box protein [Natrinema versiforme]QCS43347.1 PAS domain S-box protein [Natrinema versiforme]